MSDKSKPNLNLSGISSTNGGTFQSARIEGVGRINGDIFCSDFVQNGKMNIHGNVKATTADMNGLAAIAGNLQGERIRMDGRVTIEGDLIGEDILFNGMISVHGKCEAEKFSGKGRFRLNILNAGDIQMTLNGSSVIDEIGGENIRIRKQPGIDFAKWLKVFPFGSNKLSAQMIEGDDVYVEYTTAKVVRGTNVVIGPGCEIECVEYSAKLDQDKGSKVNKVIQI